MNTRNTAIAITALSLLMLAAGILLSARMPAQMATHWNSAGQPDGYGGAFTALYLLPLMTLGLGLMILFLPAIDPLKRNIALFRKEWNGMVLVFAVFMAWVHGASLAWNLGLRINMSLMLMPAMGLLFFYIAWLLPRSRRNWFLGIRTPWTLSSDTVWEKTHRLGSWCFAIAGVIVLASLLMGEQGFLLMMPALLIAALIPVVYSYLLYREENKKSE